MNQNEDQKINCGSQNIGSGCCKVESVVTVDSKGQILLPKDLREKANINAGDKLVVIRYDSGKRVTIAVLENYVTFTYTSLGVIIEKTTLEEYVKTHVFATLIKFKPIKE